MTSPWLVINGRRVPRSKIVARARTRQGVAPDTGGNGNGGNGGNGPENGPP
jgi:hypothetical protein